MQNSSHNSSYSLNSAEKRESSPLTCCQYFPWKRENYVSQDIISLLLDKVKLVIHVHQVPDSAFCQGSFQISGPQRMRWCCKTVSSGAGLSISPCKSSLGSRKHIPSACWSPSACQDDPISHFFQFCIISQLTEGTSAPSDTSIVKLLNNIGLSIDLWYIPLIMGLKLDFLTLIRTLQAQSLASFHLTSLSDYPAHMWTVCLWGSYRRQCQRLYWSPCIEYPLLFPLVYQARHFISL